MDNFQKQNFSYRENMKENLVLWRRRSKVEVGIDYKYRNMMLYKKYFEKFFFI